MSTYYSVVTYTVTAGAAIEKHRYVTASGQYAGAGQRGLGISARSAAAGEPLPVDLVGISIATAGGAIIKGSALEVGADGKLITKTSSGVAVAQALENASENQNFSVLLIAN